MLFKNKNKNKTFLYIIELELYLNNLKITTAKTQDISSYRPQSNISPVRVNKTFTRESVNNLIMLCASKWPPLGHTLRFGTMAFLSQPAGYFHA